MRRISVTTLCLTLLLFSLGTLAATDDGRVRPFVLAEGGQAAFADKVTSVASALKSNGFTIAGEYAPSEGAHIFIVTDSDLQKQASASDFGGYGAAIRVSVTGFNGQVQVSYTNPEWMSNVYRMSGDSANLSGRLKAALGWERGFGSGGGRTVENLREYHYMVFMPYFDDQVKLSQYDSHQAAVDAVEAGLKAGKGGVAKVSRVDVDGKDEVLFNVSLKEGKGADAPVMAIIDQEEMRHTAHLPYDILVSGNSAYMLHGKFRIAQSFPDLTMTTFMKISDAPDAIEAALKAAVSGN
jgi:hypothetical protein